MIVFIAGLGLMGASYAQRLRDQGHTVHGVDRDPFVVQEALALGLIERSDVEALSLCDVCVLALPPQEIGPFVKAHVQHLHPQALVTDIAGVKEAIAPLMTLLPDPSVYRSHHPMAGKALRGLKHRDPLMFTQAVCITVTSPYENALADQRLDALIQALGFKQTLAMSAAEHDEAIAYVSQLTHVCAAALMHQPGALDHHRAAGDSFRDLTRIAKIQAPLWRDLFMLNREPLLAQIEAFEASIKTFKQALQQHDGGKMEAWLQQAHDVKSQMEEPR